MQGNRTWHKNEEQPFSFGEVKLKHLFKMKNVR